MLYVEAEANESLRLPYVPDNAMIKRQSDLIIAVWAKINNLDFVDTSAYSDDYSGVTAFEDDLLAGKI